MALFAEVQVSLFVAGAVFGEVQVSLFVAGAVFGEVQESLFVAGAVFGEIWNDSRSAKSCFGLWCNSHSPGLDSDAVSVRLAVALRKSSASSCS